jgi:8-oxo-dGTP pyrophosphatase MutT (NUDIX family)
MLDCAIREFKEETGACLDSYNILFGIEPTIDSYISSGVQYIHTYYIAIDIGYIPSTKKGLSEIDEAQWINVNSLKYIKSHSYIHSLVKNIINRYSVYLSRQ